MSPMTPLRLKATSGFHLLALSDYSKLLTLLLRITLSAFQKFLFYTKEHIINAVKVFALIKYQTIYYLKTSKSYLKQLNA